MTTCAIITQGHLVHIDMAGDTGGADRFFEDEGSMTGATVNATVNAGQGQSGGVVIEPDRVRERGPAVRNVTCRAVHLQGVSVRGLGDGEKMHE